MFEALALKRGDGRHEPIHKTNDRMDVLMIDDWGLAVLSAPQRRDLSDVLEDRHGRASRIVTVQLAIEHWHDAQSGDPTLAGAIVDRLVHNAHWFKFTGESMRNAARNSSLDRSAHA